MSQYSEARLEKWVPLSQSQLLLKKEEGLQET